MTRKEPLTESIAHWERIAKEAEDAAKWDRDHGYDLSLPGSSPGDHRARTYRNMAEALRIQEKTGVEHCACHLKTMAECRELAQTRRAHGR